MASWIAASAAHAATFGMLALIDGVASGTQFDRLELVAVAGARRHVINPTPEDDLHNLFQSLVMTQGGELRLP